QINYINPSKSNVTAWADDEVTFASSLLKKPKMNNNNRTENQRSARPFSTTNKQQPVKTFFLTIFLLTAILNTSCQINSGGKFNSTMIHSENQYFMKQPIMSMTSDASLSPRTVE